jgi:hypothetical protein
MAEHQANESGDWSELPWWNRVWLMVGVGATSRIGAP